MQNLVTAQEMKAADKRTSEQFGLDSLVLMERAALSAKEILSKQFSGADRFLFFAEQAIMVEMDWLWQECFFWSKSRWK